MDTTLNLFYTYCTLTTSCRFSENVPEFWIGSTSRSFAAVSKILRNLYRSLYLGSTNRFVFCHIPLKKNPFGHSTASIFITSVGTDQDRLLYCSLEFSLLCSIHTLWTTKSVTNFKFSLPSLKSVAIIPWQAFTFFELSTYQGLPLLALYPRKLPRILAFLKW